MLKIRVCSEDKIEILKIKIEHFSMVFHRLLINTGVDNCFVDTQCLNQVMKYEA